MRLRYAIAKVGSFTALSRIFGLVREVFMGHFLGTSLVTDAFIVAFKFPNFFRRFFAEGAFNAAFLPEYSRQLKENPSQANYMANQVFFTMAWGLSFFSLLVIVFAPFFVSLIAPGFDDTPERYSLAIFYTRITFSYIVFISLCSLLSGVLNAMKEFSLPAALPVILNLVMISAFLFHGSRELYGQNLAIAVVIAGIIQLGLLLWRVRKIGVKIYFVKITLGDDVKKILRLMLPSALSAGVMQVNIFIDMIIASFLPAGALSYLYYADRLNQLPLAIFGIAIGTALLPRLSELFHEKNTLEKAYITQKKSIIFSIALSVPAAIGLIMLATNIVECVYGHGAFSQASVYATAKALAAFAIGLPAYAVIKIFTTTFFAVQDTKTPLKTTAIAVIVNLILNLMLIQYYQHVGMAIATSLAAWVQAFYLAYLLRGKQLIRFKGLAQPLVKVFVASILMIAYLVGVKAYNLNLTFNAHAIIQKGFNLFMVISSGMVVYFLSYAALTKIKWSAQHTD